MPFPAGQIAIPVMLALLGDPAPEIDEYHLVVLGTFDDIVRAGKVSTRASSRLGLPLASDTLGKAYKGPRYSGDVVAVHVEVDGKFSVISYLGEELAAKRALATARPSFPRARLRTIELPDTGVDHSYRPWVPRSVLILASTKTFVEAEAVAKRVSAESGLPYSTRGMVYDTKRGLIWPDSDTNVYGGTYMGRRYDKCAPYKKRCLSVERSDFYRGFASGFYIVVGGLLGDEEVPAVLARMRPMVPDAYVKKTSVYMGCLH